MTLSISKESPIDIQASSASNTLVATDTAALKPSNNNRNTAIGGCDLSTNSLLASNEGKASPMPSEPVAHPVAHPSPGTNTVTMEPPATGSDPIPDTVPHPSGPTSLDIDAEAYGQRESTTMNASVTPMSPVGAVKSLGGTTSATEASLDLDGVANTTNTSVTPVSPAGAVDLPGKDEVMGDATSSGLTPPDLPMDDEAPVWLFPMMEYLRGVADDTAWHRLLTEFIDFEKRGPLNGVSCDFALS